MARIALATTLIAALCTPRFPTAAHGGTVAARLPSPVPPPSQPFDWRHVRGGKWSFPPPPRPHPPTHAEPMGMALHVAWTVDEPAPDPHPPVSLAPAAEPPPLTYREQVLHELHVLGAAEWIVHGLDCLGWWESGWQNIRSHRANFDGTYDHGGPQINDVNVRRFGLDPYVPANAAYMALQLVFGRLARGDRPFADWATEARCGLR